MGRRVVGDASLDKVPWVLAGRSIDVGGRLLRGGLVYVGQAHELPALSSWPPGRTDLALIDLDLEIVARAHPFPEFGRFAGYQGMSPTARAVCLKWLGSDRCDPNIDAQVLWAYLFGLERALLVDLPAERIPASQRAAVLAELERLLAGYGRQHPGFAQQLRQLFDFASPLSGERFRQPPGHAISYRERSLPPELRVALGRMAEASRPIPPEWAQALWAHHPRTPWRAVAAEYPQQFSQLFAAQYRRRYGHGLRLDPAPEDLVLTYEPSSSSLVGREFTRDTGIPVVAGTYAAAQELDKIAQQVCAELEPYRRRSSHSADVAVSLEAFSLLPPQAWSPDDPRVAALLAIATAGAEEALEYVVPLSDLVKPWAISRLRKSEAVGLGRLLAAYGVGIEPDLRHGDSVPQLSTKVVLFSVGEKPRGAASDKLAFACAQVEFCVVATRGRCGERGFQTAWRLTRQGLEDFEERARLRAHFVYALQNPARRLPRGSVELLAGGVQQTIAVLLAVLEADCTSYGDADESLRRGLSQLGLDRDGALEVMGGRTALDATLVADLVELRTAGVASRGFQLRPKTVAIDGPLTLCPKRIAVIAADTEKTQRLLADIFEPEPSHAKVPAAPSGGLWGLDAPHEQLARQLATRSCWTRAEVLHVADELALPLDGALDVVNEASFDTHGEPLCDGIDPLIINSALAEEFA